MTAELVNLKVLKSRVSPEIFLEFCKESNICPECLSESLTISHDDSHEVVCSRCGLVVGRQIQQSHSLPGYGAETNYMDTCQLTFGKNLGSHLNKYEMYSVLSKAPNGKRDLGVRALMVANATNIEKRQIQNLLNYGSHLCKQYGLDGKDRKSVIFADGLGRVLRVCGLAALALSRGTIQAKRLAYACFVWLYKQTFQDGSNIQEELEVKDGLLSWVSNVVRDIALPKGVEIFGKKNMGGLPRNVVVFEYPDDLPVLRFKPKAQKN